LDSFELKHDRGKLIAIVEVNGVAYEKEVTDYFEKANAHDDWLDYRMGLRDLAENSKFTRNKL